MPKREKKECADISNSEQIKNEDEKAFRIIFERKKAVKLKLIEASTNKNQKNKIETKMPSTLFIGIVVFLGVLAALALGLVAFMVKRHGLSPRSNPVHSSYEVPKVSRQH